MKNYNKVQIALDGKEKKVSIQVKMKYCHLMMKIYFYEHITRYNYFKYHIPIQRVYPFT